MRHLLSRKISLPVLIQLFVLAACTKNGDSYTITGIALDYDLKTPLQGAWIYCKSLRVEDGQLDVKETDINGMVQFTYKKEGRPKHLYGEKLFYIRANIGGRVDTDDNDRTDTLYFVKPSLVNLLVKRANSYQVGDTIEVKLKGNIAPNYNFFEFTRLYRNSALAPDSLFNIRNFYFSPGGTRLYFSWEIFRNGTLLSGQTDSTDLIQYGTKSHTLNY